MAIEDAIEEIRDEWREAVIMYNLADQITDNIGLRKLLEGRVWGLSLALNTMGVTEDEIVEIENAIKDKIDEVVAEGMFIEEGGD